jgi:hypothetical protein
MRQGSRPAVPDDAVVVEDFLKLGGGTITLSGCQVCLCAYIDRIEAGNVVAEWRFPQLEGVSRLQQIQGRVRAFSIQRRLRLYRFMPN